MGAVRRRAAGRSRGRAGGPPGASAAGLRVHYALHLAAIRHPARLPPVVRVEDTVLDLVDRPTTTDAQIIDLVLRACQRRITTPAHLAVALDARKKIRRRALVSDLIAEAATGVASTLERGYHRDVEVAHGLPTGHRNRTEGRPGRRRYRDIRYLEFQLVVELDGRGAPSDRLARARRPRGQRAASRRGHPHAALRLAVGHCEPVRAAQVARLLRTRRLDRHAAALRPRLPASPPVIMKGAGNKCGAKVS